MPCIYYTKVSKLCCKFALISDPLVMPSNHNSIRDITGGFLIIFVSRSFQDNNYNYTLLECYIKRKIGNNL